MRLVTSDQFSFLLYEDFPVPENSENVLAHKKAASLDFQAPTGRSWRPFYKSNHTHFIWITL
jgi:hypothetical protein